MLRSLSRSLSVISLSLGGMIGSGLFAIAPGLSAQENDPAMKTARELLKLPARPKRPELPPSELPLKFLQGERVAFLGNSTAERMNLFGNFETILQLRFAKQELVVRNFARPAEEVGNHQRANDYTKLDDPLAAFGADTYFMFFGFNESFAGEAGIEKYKADYEKYIDEISQRYPRDDEKSQPRFVLVSPIAVEPSGDRLLPNPEERNKLLAIYRDATKAVAEKRKLPFVDLFDASLKTFSKDTGLQFTINGTHVNEEGDRVVGQLLDRSLFGNTPAPAVSQDKLTKLRNAINDKSWVHLQDYRMINGWYIYGGRRTWDTETFPREYRKIRNMASVRDRYIWDIALGKQVADRPDDKDTGELITPETRFGDPRQKYSENAEGGPTILPPEDLIKTCNVPPGFEMKLFADERKFPEIAKPVQIGFDSKGRLWVSTMPSYPQWKPGDAAPSDKLVILEDTDKDGLADKSTVFYDKLHCPTGFQFYNGGVLVVDQPRMLWLQDTDGDDKADKVVHVMDGWATEDTHHTIGAFEASPSGLLHMLEGVAMSTAVETPWGPFRNFGSSGAYVLDPRTWQVRHFVTPGYGNPWCYLFNEWGQGFCGDGTGANQHWDTPLSGAQYQGRKGLNPVFDTEGMRPVVGSDFLWSRQFPDDIQGQFIYACVINMNGLPRWTFSDDGAGFKGIRVRHNPNDKNTPFDLLKSTDKHFRPVDPQIGPDGALWFGDWANPLIGHMQYSQRDPNRDHIHGRIYRLVYKDKPLLDPVTQFGKPVPELLEQLKSYEWRTRYRARAELQARPEADVLAAAKKWLTQIESDPAAERLKTEVLWLQTSFHAVDPAFLKTMLASKSSDARAAATRVLADERDRFPESQAWLIQQAGDSHPRVRAEADRGLSYFATPEAMTAVANSVKENSDPWLDYTADAALGANISAWRPLHLRGDFTKGNEKAQKMVESIIALDKKAAEIVPYLQILLGKEAQPEETRNKAVQAISDMKGGNAENGKLVFRRTCIACHKVFGEGADFGPDMMKVGTRLTPFKIVDSIIDPNADIEEKYLSTQIQTQDGDLITGLLVKETEKEVVIFDGKTQKTIPVADIEEMRKLRQSSMPEGLAATLSPTEFLDVIEFLKGLK